MYMLCVRAHACDTCGLLPLHMFVPADARVRPSSHLYALLMSWDLVSDISCSMSSQCHAECA